MKLKKWLIFSSVLWHSVTNYWKRKKIGRWLGSIHWLLNEFCDELVEFGFYCCPGKGMHRTLSGSPPQNSFVAINPVTLLQQTIGCPICWPLVHRELEVLVLSSPTPATGCASPEELRWCLEIHYTQLPARAESVAFHTGHPAAPPLQKS